MNENGLTQITWPGKNFRYGGRGDWLHCNAGNISVLNHGSEPVDITQARVCTRVCKTCKLNARFMLVNVLSQSIHFKQKVKVKIE